MSFDWEILFELSWWRLISIDGCWISDRSQQRVLQSVANRLVHLDHRRETPRTDEETRDRFRSLDAATLKATQKINRRRKAKRRKGKKGVESRLICPRISEACKCNKDDAQKYAAAINHVQLFPT